MDELETGVRKTSRLAALRAPNRMRLLTVMLVGDIPDVTARIAEAGGADPPGTIYRPVQQFDSAALQFVDHRIHVVNTE